MSLATQLKSVALPTAKRALYVSGALSAYHSARNRDRLTVIMFHRVLSVTDPRWRTADPEYTLRDDLFAECVAFFQRHYHVVSIDDVLAARRGTTRLPPHPLLITFDDGWSDNVEFALPHLRRAGVPALLFVVADAIDRDTPFFQERLVAAWRSGRLTPDGAAQLWRAAVADGSASPPFAAVPRDDLGPLRQLITRLEQLESEPRAALLSPLADVLADGVCHMVTSAQLATLAAASVAIGAHGKSHTPLTRAADLDAELGGARAAIAACTGSAPPVTMSFPHGAHTPELVDRARAAGYELLFTSVPDLPPAGGGGSVALGRVGFTGATITDRHGRFAPELLALHLFRRPHAP